ncbi:28260_t:CDS:2 [Dentiscutata erythropus]|uniref:28260_t:CDS:1 n=1 Tax=Dentiscutata erythropus TaxID=1348616 RepID=A0A9N8YT77_9GLOM|nr:28260_t:CDS:2 [Dentiscutata erythropus]
MDNAINLLQDSIEISVSIKTVTGNTSNGFNLKDGSFVHKLPKEATLEKIRDTLMRRRGEDEILQPSDSETILYIRQTTDYDWTQLIMKCEHGFTFDEDNIFIKDASESAFKISVNKIQRKYLLNNHSEDEKECEHNLEAFCKRNLILGGNVLASSLWLSTSLGLSHEVSKQMFSHLEKYTKCSHQKWEKAVIVLQESCISPTEEFIKAVENALIMSTDSKKLEKLREISKKYGQFYARRLVFGGAIVKEKKYTSNSNESSKTKTIDSKNKISLSALSVAKADVNLNISRSTEKKAKVFNYYSTVRTRVVGGITEEYDNQDDSIKPWLKSLKDHATWDVIEYDEIGLIFDLLDDKLRKQIFDVLGYPILKEDIKIRECQIYASIMGEEDKSVFSFHVNYVDEETPEIVVHSIQNKAENRNLILKLCWIIVEKNRCVIENTGASRFSESCILCTCVLEPDIITNNDSSSATDNSATISGTNSVNSAAMSGSNSAINNYTPTKIIKDISSIIIGTHIALYKHSACLFAYDTKERNKVLDKNVLQRLSLYACVVDSLETYNSSQTGARIPLEACSFGQKEVTWRKSRTHNKISYSQKNALFTKEQASNNLIFVNQIFDYCFEIGSENCQYHGSVNVKSDEIIYGSFNSKSLDKIKGKFSYLIVPTHI